MVNPYCDNNNVRTFSEEVDELDLIWHRDREDRIVEIVGKTDWKIQLENQLPTSINESIELLSTDLLFSNSVIFSLLILL